MNMISLPRPTCPYCDATMRRWPLGQAVLACDTCRRPIVRYLAQPSSRIFRLRPVYTVIYAAAFVVLLITLAMVAFNPVETRHIIPAIAIPIAMFGACDIADGWLSWRTSIDRGWRTLRRGRAARAMGLARGLFGIAGVAVAIIGLLAYDEIAESPRPGTTSPKIAAGRM
jgi:hypothetical protein